MNLPPWLLVLLTVLTVARLTRLITADALTEPLREWVISHRPAPAAPVTAIHAPAPPPQREDWLVYLIHCRWCASMWIAIPVAVIVYFWPTFWAVQIVLVALASSHVTALLARFED